MSLIRAILPLVAVVLATATPVVAHEAVPAALRDVGFDQRLDAPLPLAVQLSDERGEPVALGDLLAGRAAVLTLNQYRCPHLCPFVLEDLARVVAAMPLVLGRDYVVVTVGIDPREGPAEAAAKKAELVAAGLPATRAGAWHFVTGSEGAIRAVARAIGFRYTYDRAADEYAHPTGVVVVTPEGRVARYLLGMAYPPRDLRLALVEAARGRIGGLVEQLLLACYRYDAHAGRYTPAVLAIVRAGGAVTALGIGLFLFVMFRAERRRQP
jgi:protein SCO1/2